MSDAIHVQFSAISAGSAEIEAIAAQIKNDLHHLEQVLAPVVRTWSGDAFAAYQRLQQQWNTAADDIARVTQEVSVALDTTHGNYRRTEDTNQSMWAH